MNRSVLLFNPNRMRPPVAPLALDYLAADLQRRGYEPAICDPMFDDWRTEIEDALLDARPVAIGVTIRNLDDAYFASQDFVLEETRRMVEFIRERIDSFIVLGGCGFSIAPAAIMQFIDADYGIAGDGEIAFADLLDRLLDDRPVDDVPGIVYRKNRELVVSPPHFADLASLPPPPRGFIDTAVYFEQGGQAGVETKRGCNQQCIYCVDACSKGHQLRLRNPDEVAQEFSQLAALGVTAVHLCDAEFNLPPEHAHAVCEALIRRHMPESIQWYTYASPKPFDAELAHTMAAAGCAGINFGADHLDDTMLQTLGRAHTGADVLAAVHHARSAGIAVMVDTLLGGPGETPESIAKTIDGLRKSDGDCFGLSCGIRVYPNTRLACKVLEKGDLDKNPNLHGCVTDNDSLLRPVFYVDAVLGPGIHRLVAGMVGDDERFFAPAAAQLDQNYNYNDNTILGEAIRAGARGAYWDILRPKRR